MGFFIWRRLLLPRGSLFDCSTPCGVNRICVIVVSCLEVQGFCWFVGLCALSCSVMFVVSFLGWLLIGKISQARLLTHLCVFSPQTLCISSLPPVVLWENGQNTHKRWETLDSTKVKEQKVCNHYDQAEGDRNPTLSSPCKPRLDSLFSFMGAFYWKFEGVYRVCLDPK